MKHDLFKLTQEKVETIMSKYKIDIDFNDDDVFNDFMVGELSNYPFTFGEKQILFTYNSMLQTIAFTIEDLFFTMEIR